MFSKRAASKTNSRFALLGHAGYRAACSSASTPPPCLTALHRDALSRPSLASPSPPSSQAASARTLAPGGRLSVLVGALAALGAWETSAARAIMANMALGDGNACPSHLERGCVMCGKTRPASGTVGIVCANMHTDARACVHACTCTSITPCPCALDARMLSIYHMNITCPFMHAPVFAHPRTDEHQQANIIAPALLSRARARERAA